MNKRNVSCGLRMVSIMLVVKILPDTEKDSEKLVSRQDLPELHHSKASCNVIFQGFNFRYDIMSEDSMIK